MGLLSGIASLGLSMALSKEKRKKSLTRFFRTMALKMPSLHTHAVKKKAANAKNTEHLL